MLSQNNDEEAIKTLSSSLAKLVARLSIPGMHFGT